MIRAYSQRLSPPYSGQIQIAESERARALSIDGEVWEIHYLNAIIGEPRTNGGRTKGTFKRVAYINHSDLNRISQQSESDNANIDERILELVHYLADIELPFPATDIYEYWLLDGNDDSPLAMIFSCSNADDMSTFPNHPVWTALQAAVMPIEATEREKDFNELPVNYRLERLVEQRAGPKPRARWYKRREHEAYKFPVLMLREDWDEEQQQSLCRRYLERQAPRLLTMHNLTHNDRLQLEVHARAHVDEVERFYPLYPAVADTKLMNTMRVEARLRGSKENQSSVKNRRDGIHYL